MADSGMAEAIRARFGAALVVVEAPTPEVDALMSSMAEHFAADAEDRSYFEDGAAVEDIAALFACARELYPLEPWMRVDEEDTLRLDIPALGVSGACVSVVGAMGESMGFLVFPSQRHFERYIAAAEAVDAAGFMDMRLDMGTPLLSLTFERGRDLPAGMKREAQRHRWPVAGPAAYPVVERRERDGFPMPLPAAGGLVTGSERYLVNGSEVRLTVPFDDQPGDEPQGLNVPARPGRR